MSCDCNFKLYSNSPNGTERQSSINERAAVEVYDLPCEVAIKFLRQLDNHNHTYTYPIHKVSYKISKTNLCSKNNGNYTSTHWETPSEAAAKIELFMEHSRYMPKTEKED